MKLIFMGTSSFAVPSLKTLAATAHQLALVVTRPDKPAGRGLQIHSSAIKKAAEELQLPTFQPLKIGAEESRNVLEELQPDLCIVAAYGQILPPSVLSIARLGNINVHASLLPKYRGAAPIQRALMAGESESGVTTMWMSPGMDEGDIILQKSLSIAPEETYGALHDRLAEAGAQALLETLTGLAGAGLPGRPQDPSVATYAPPVTPADARICWNNPAAAIHDQVRALNPSPGAYCIWRGKRLKLWKVEKAPVKEGFPGKIVEFCILGPLVAAGEGGVVLAEVQPEGRKWMTGSEFLRGYRLSLGEEFS